MVANEKLHAKISAQNSKKNEWWTNKMNERGGEGKTWFLVSEMSTAFTMSAIALAAYSK